MLVVGAPPQTNAAPTWHSKDEAPCCAQGSQAD